MLMQSRHAILINKVDVYNLEQLRENFVIEEVIDLFKNGQLTTWLEQCHYDDLLPKVKELSETELDTATLIQKLVSIFNIELGTSDIDLIAATVERPRVPAIIDKKGLAIDILGKIDKQKLQEIESIEYNKRLNFLSFIISSQSITKQAVDAFFEKDWQNFSDYSEFIFKYLTDNNDPALLYFMSYKVFWKKLGAYIPDSSFANGGFTTSLDYHFPSFLKYVEETHNAKTEECTANELVNLVPAGTKCISWYQDKPMSFIQARVAHLLGEPVSLFSAQGTPALCRSKYLFLTDGLSYKSLPSMTIHYVTLSN